MKAPSASMTLDEAFGEPSSTLRPHVGILVDMEKKEIVLLYAETLETTDPLFRNYKGIAERACGIKYPGWTFQTRAVAASELADTDARRSKAKLEKSSRLQLEVRRIINDCVAMQASDIHFESGPGDARIRARVNGELFTVSSVPAEKNTDMVKVTYNTMCEFADAIFSGQECREAMLARRWIPDGLSGIRVICGPSFYGPFMVLRLLYTESVRISGGVPPLSALGYNDRQISLVGSVARKPSGIMFVSGKVNSGKSTALKYMMEDVSRDPRKAVIAVQDPPECAIRDVCQIPVNVQSASEDRDTAFARTVMSVLRLDPDCLMIGEIRDQAGAMMAVRCALSGHKVWTTIHAGSSFGILGRMLDLLISEKFTERRAVSLLTDPMVVNALVYQNLVPVLCPECRIPLKDIPGITEDSRFSSLVKAFTADFRVTGKNGVRATDTMAIEFLRENAFTANRDPRHRCNNPHCRNGIAGMRIVAEVVVAGKRLLEDALLSGRGTGYARSLWMAENPDQTLQANTRKLVAEGMLDPFLAMDIVGSLDADILEPEHG